MTTKPRAKKFRIRRNETLGGSGRGGPPADGATPANDSPEAAATRPAEQKAPAPPEAPEQPAGVTGEVDSPRQVAAETDINAIRAEGLTGRQLRMARRVAQKHGLAVTSDFDAVRQLRARGIDPFQRANVISLVAPDGTGGPPAAGGAPATSDGQARLPIKAETAKVPAAQVAQVPDSIREAAEKRASEIRRIQEDIARRRRAKMVALFLRLAAFVLLPTVLVGYYFYNIATPMYATTTEFGIQQQGSPTASGMSGLFQGTSFATQQDSITVQAHLTSREVLVKLVEEEGYREHFSDPDIDPLNRLDPDATIEDTYKLFRKNVKVSYDPTEGNVRMEVIAASPEASQRFSEALLRYAEARINDISARARTDAMASAREAYEQTEAEREAALAELVRVQAEAEALDPVSEAQALLTRINNLEVRRDELVIELQTLLDNRRPNEARVNALQSEISRIDDQIAVLRAQMTAAPDGGQALNQINARLRAAEENYAARLAQVQVALQSMEAARLEADRQVRYLSLGVRPIAPDEPTYPRKFENTLLAFFIFAGIYLMISLTASVLREQVSA